MTKARARQAGGKGPVRVWFVRLVRFLAGLFVGLHIYAAALIFLPVPGTILMVQRAAGGEHLRRTMTPLEDISPFLVTAVIAAEDTRYCAHSGIDTEAIRKAIDEYQSGKKARGASTITQQTAKNVFFWNGGGAPRKLGDMWMATFIDHVWGKRRVMEVYLNVAEWGDGIFGAEAAAQARFGKPASKLTEREAALLAAVLPSPNKWRVDPPGPYVTKRAGSLQARMRVVRHQGLDACVFGDTRPAPLPPVKGEPAPPPPEAMPDLPPEPEALPDAPGGDTPIASDDPLNQVLDAADESFTQPAPETVEDPEPFVVDETTAPASLSEPEPEPEPAPEATGPVDLRPRNDLGLEPEPAADDPPQ